MSRHRTKWRVVVAGGHARSVGKTSLVVDLIRAFPEARFTAVKITQYGHGICVRNGANCGCAPDDHSAAMDWETDPTGRTDTSRFLAAGAVRAIWLRTKQGRLAEGLPLLRSALEEHGCPEGPTPRSLIIESNSLLQFIKPNAYLVVLDPGAHDFKDSARLYLDRADAFVLRRELRSEALPILQSPEWPGVSARTLLSKPRFLQPLGEALPNDLKQFVSDRFVDAEPVAL